MRPRAGLLRRSALFATVAVAAASVAPAPAAGGVAVSAHSHSIRGKTSWGPVSMDFNATRHVIRRSDTAAERTIQGLCLHVRDAARKRYEFGCGTLTLTVDPLMESAAITGRIPTVVRVLNQTRQIARSTIDIRVDLTGTGLVKPGSAPLARCLFSDGASLSVWSSLGTWRAATGRLSLRSAFLGPYFSTPLQQGFVFEARHQAVVASDTPLVPALVCAPV